jgi:hypothetical protein
MNAEQQQERVEDATRAELVSALRLMLEAFSTKTEYLPLEEAAAVRLAAKKAARVALAKAEGI